TGNGQLTVTVTFRIGTDLNVAQMLTQNRVQDALPRLPEDVQRLGVQVRKSIDPDRAAAHDLTASEILAALRAQNVQVSAGILNQPPVARGAAYQINVEALGRLATPEQFGDIVLKSDPQGRVTHLRDIGRVEVGAADYG
ncbi:efflux RND transporter permease subunit, partial [Burkholderia anthina]|uniref:efflux RND transporter permease subunit n=1 Tax=Burkholderia anthina TaxID=179879 RepID=UPI00158D5912